ncbi:MAG: hypothetical protein IT349_03000 [Candidatus Eisenbacteria bacterium]|nr:hypothetical protein [Candidatus Eisenbacteria bacterium]MCC7141047.1 hypothetical protein [Candidatus Eisenbacteria bacterium]
MLALALLGIGLLHPSAAPGETKPGGSGIPICLGNGGLPELPLTATITDSVGQALSRHNHRVVARTDSLYRAGRFGRPGSDEAKKRALIHFQLRSWSGFRYTADFANQTRQVLVAADDAPLAPFSADYANVAVYPLRFIDQVRIGRGGFCINYAIPDAYDEQILDGGVTVRIRRMDLELDHQGVRPVINREQPTSEHSTVELLYEACFAGRVTEERVVDRGDTLLFLSIDNIEGAHVRKFGTHRLGAITEWRSLVRGDDDPANPRIGAAAYFPEIHLEMPFFLPDLGLDDLRAYDYPLPVMETSWYRSPPSSLPEWLKVDPSGTIKNWKLHGPRPKALTERYPDL